MYVADTGNNRIQKFTSDGTFITKWEVSGSYEVGSQSISGIAVDSSGNVYVADWERKKIHKFTGDGILRSNWGSTGSGNGQFGFPYPGPSYGPNGVAIDSSGNVYVADTGNNRIQKFTGDGTFITKWGTLGTGNGQFYRLRDVAVDSSGRVYVADGNNIQVFFLKPIVAIPIAPPVAKDVN